jgi:hypothetical protein
MTTAPGILVHESLQLGAVAAVAMSVKERNVGSA